MSKLSDAVKEINKDNFSTVDWDSIEKTATKGILNLEFTPYKYDDYIFMKIDENSEYNFSIFVKINVAARTTPYCVIVTKLWLKDLIIEMDTNPKSSKFKAKDVSNLEYRGEQVDIGELKTYLNAQVIESIGPKNPYTSTTIMTETTTIDREKAKSKLNEEIDKGFRKQDTRAALGGETLENDIAFNDYLHRKMYRGHGLN